jgi:hypothetical protein
MWFGFSIDRPRKWKEKSSWVKNRLQFLLQGELKIDFFLKRRYNYSTDTVANLHLLTSCFNKWCAVKLGF